MLLIITLLVLTLVLHFTVIKRKRIQVQEADLKTKPQIVRKSIYHVWYTQSRLNPNGRIVVLRLNPKHLDEKMSDDYVRICIGEL